MIKGNMFKILRTSLILKESFKTLQVLNLKTSSLYRLSAFNFAKKVGDKKGQLKQEKQQIEKEYDDLGEDDIKEKYTEKAQV